VKEFVVYTLLRFALFGAVLAIVLGIWWAATGAEGVTETQLLVSMVVAFIVSGIASYYLLHDIREQFARRVHERAAKASGKLEEMRSAEDE
jgi:small-conductance mechanosensitive channel